MADVRIGILGVGGFGLFCLEQYQRMLGVTVTAIAGTRPEKYRALAHQYGIPHVAADWRALAAHPAVDILHLATPPDLRVGPALAAMAAGKHVFCEKPLALTLEEADTMLTAAGRCRVRLGINFVMRYSPLYEALRVLVQQEVLGAPLRLLFENHAADLPPGHWFWNPESSGTIPVEHGGHFFDIFSSILGPGWLRWAGRTCRPDGCEDKWQVILQHGPRLLASYYHAFDKPAPLERTWCVLECAHGRIRLDGWVPERLEMQGMVSAETVTRLPALLPGAWITAQELGGGPWQADGRPLTHAMLVQARLEAGEKLELYGQAIRGAMADFIAWTQRPTHQPRVTAADGRAALALALEARARAREQAGDEPPFP